MDVYCRGEDFKNPNWKWNVGIIDQKIQKQRYTPLYNKHAGIENGKLIGTDQFTKKWETAFAQVKFKSGEKPTE